MSKKIAATVTGYFAICAIILGWWLIAFKPAIKDEIGRTENSFGLQEAPFPPLFKSLSPLRRETLQAGLAGDISLMMKLIADWDLDAQILETQGLAKAKRLSRSDYIRSQVLGRQLKNASARELQELSDLFQSKAVRDDNGQEIGIDPPFQRFLPQTYVAASFLLALADPAQIVAIPRGLRDQVHIYPNALTKQIPLDIDRHNAEKLYAAKPQLAFVAHYSHPSTIQALRSQGIQLFTLKNIETIPEISDALIRVGHVINRPLEAELLKLFIEASMLAIDNRLLALNLQFSEQQQTSPRLLFLNYHTQYSAPTDKTLTGQLLNRIGIQDLMSKIAVRKKGWTIQLEQEQIINLNPDCLIIAATNNESLKKQILEDPAFKQLPAFQNKRVFFVDQFVQESPCQYIVLAYYDIYEALALSRFP